MSTTDNSVFAVRYAHQKKQQDSPI